MKLKTAFISLALSVAFLMPSCTFLKTNLLGGDPVEIPDALRFQDFETPVAGVPKSQQQLNVEVLNHQVDSYNKAIAQVNKYIRSVDGMQKNASLFALGGKSFLGVASIATAALTAASPANHVWGQAGIATTAAFGGVEKEFENQHLSKEAIRQSLVLTATEIAAAMNKVHFDRAYQVIGDDRAFGTLIAANQSAISELSAAITIKRFSQVVTVRQSKPASTTSTQSGEE